MHQARVESSKAAPAWDWEFALVDYTEAALVGGTMALALVDHTEAALVGGTMAFAHVDHTEAALAGGTMGRGHHEETQAVGTLVAEIPIAERLGCTAIMG